MKVVTLSLLFSIFLSNFICALFLRGIRDNYNGIDYMYQFPSDKPKGVVLLFHGCSHSGTDFWTPDTTCKTCLGLPIETNITISLLTNGFLPIAITSTNRDHKCWSPQDKPASLAKVIKHFYTTQFHSEPFPTLPLFLLGASSGGRYVGNLSYQLHRYDIHISGVIIQISPMILPEKSIIFSYIPPIEFIDMIKDGYTSELIDMNIKVLNQYNIPTRRYTISPQPLSSDYFTYNNVLSLKDSTTVVNALQVNGYLNEYLYLKEDPRMSGWRQVIEPFIPHIIPQVDTLIPDESGIAELMNVAYASHEIISDHVLEAVLWLYTLSSNKTPPSDIQRIE